MELWIIGEDDIDIEDIELFKTDSDVSYHNDKMCFLDVFGDGPVDGKYLPEGVI